MVVSLLAVSIMASIIAQRLERESELEPSETPELAETASQGADPLGTTETEIADNDVSSVTPHTNRRSSLQKDSQARTP